MAQVRSYAGAPDALATWSRGYAEASVEVRVRDASPQEVEGRLGKGKGAR